MRQRRGVDMGVKTGKQIDRGMAKQAAIWALVSLGLGAALAAGVSALIIGGIVDIRYLHGAAYSCCTLGVFAGSYIGARRASVGKLPFALLTGGLCVLVLLVLGLLLPEKGVSGIGVVTACCMGGALAAGVLANRRPRRNARRRK